MPLNSSSFGHSCSYGFDLARQFGQGAGRVLLRETLLVLKSLYSLTEFVIVLNRVIVVLVKIELASKFRSLQTDSVSVR